MVYDVSNPHPMYGKDPNILNEYGHTEYPKMVYPNGKDSPGVVVKDKKHENEVLGIKEEPKKAASKEALPKSWE